MKNNARNHFGQKSVGTQHFKFEKKLCFPDKDDISGSLTMDDFKLMGLNKINSEEIKVPKSQQQLRNSQHICNQCNITFRHADHLSFHMKIIHLTNFSFSCKQCSFTCNANFKLREHMKDSHGPKALIRRRSEDKENECDLQLEKQMKLDEPKFMDDSDQCMEIVDDSYNCTKCQFETISKKCAFKHIEAKHGVMRKHACSKCHSRFYTLGNLNVHISTIHPAKIDQRFTCKLCSREYTSQYSLNRHCIQFHPVTPSDVFQCNIGACTSQFLKKEKLLAHKQLKHKPISTVFKAKEQVDKTNEQVDKAKEQVDKTSEQVDKANEQVDIHCPVCRREFSSLLKLDSHLECEHKEQNDYMCFYCNFEFPYQKDLKKHLDNKHKDMRNFRCAYCISSFPKKAKLATHIKSSHLVTANKTITNAPSVAVTSPAKSHASTSMPQRRVKQFKCSDCYASFKCDTKLQSHLFKMHLKFQNFECRHRNCNVKFLTLNKLNQHMMDHLHK